jgi:osmotically inducible protein OsmC
MAVNVSSAEWRGSLKEGAGTMKFGSAYEGPFTYASRFESGAGINPEQLIGAAHAGCYSMFLSALLTNAGFPPAQINTTATVHLGAGPTITKIELNCTAEVPGVSEEEFQAKAVEAKAKCPISKALAAVETVELNATLVA